jgi:LysM repeat protein
MNTALRSGRWRAALILLITLLCIQVTPALADASSQTHVESSRVDIIYIVQRNDTLYGIALRYGVTVTAIAQANGITNVSLIFVGQRLIIPTGGSVPVPTSPPPSGGSACGNVYTVQRGDTLFQIALKCRVSTFAIASANGLINLNLIYVGQRLTIPGGGSAPLPVPTSTVVPTNGPLPTATATPALTHGITGQLTLCNPSKLTYATYERVCLNMLLKNQTAQPVSYTFLGLHAVSVSGGASVFHTSWSGVLSIPAKGVGPTSSGWEDGLYLSPGSYKITLDICYAVESDCRQSIGWEVLTSGITVKIV